MSKKPSVTRSKKAKNKKSTSKKNTGTIRAFFNVVSRAGSAHHHDVVWMMNKLFSPDTGKTPSLGIASGAGPLGPHFDGVQAVSLFFTQLFKSFPTLDFAASPNPKKPRYCFSQDGNTITVQTTLKTGLHKERWFPPGHKAYSKPLSDILPDGTKSSTVPACAVFTFDTNPRNPPNRILNLAIYMDRWQMAVDLWDRASAFSQP